MKMTYKPTGTVVVVPDAQAEAFLARGFAVCNPKAAEKAAAKPKAAKGAAKKKG